MEIGVHLFWDMIYDIDTFHWLIWFHAGMTAQRGDMAMHRNG